MAGRLEKPRRVSQAVFSNGDRPGHLFLREKDFSEGKRLVHLHLQMLCT